MARLNSSQVLWALVIIVYSLELMYLCTSGAGGNSHIGGAPVTMVRADPGDIQMEIPNPADDDDDDDEDSPKRAAANTDDAAAAKPAEPVDENAIQADGFSLKQKQMMREKAQQHQFAAEIDRLMDIIINSIYSNREIFLRELISNASDALDKIRFAALTNKELLGDHPELEIRIKYDKDSNTLTIADTGIGMTSEDLVKHLGVVASSGTTKFVDAASSGKDTLSLIGQFGVGFYSVYLVADGVTVVSKHNDDDQYVWESTANKTFTVTKDPRGNTLGRGTQVILHLKNDAKEFVNQDTLEKTVTRYSEFINFPIFMYKSEQVTKEVPVEEEGGEDDADKKKKSSEEEEEIEEEDIKKKSEDDAAEKKPKTKSVTETVWQWKQLNEKKAIWTRSPNDVSKDEYNSFYKAISKDSTDPLTWIHFKAEGELSFKSLLYIPGAAPFDLYDKYYGKSNALRLYVRRVLISDEFEDLMPRYLNFIRGLVDSDDLPLTVSRETLSKNRVLKVMGKKLTRKALEMLKKLADDSTSAAKELKDFKDDDIETSESDDEETKAKKREEREKEKRELKETADKYLSFWKNFGKSVKLGVIEDTKNRDRLTELLRFVSVQHEDTPISLQDYVDQMKEGQEKIYYITGPSVEACKNSPFLEKLKQRGYDVLLLVDPLDEYVSSYVTEYDGKKLVSITKEGDLGLKDDEKRQRAVEKAFTKFAEWFKSVLGDRVEKVIVSTRLHDSPCVLTTSQWGWSANMERIMKAQTFADPERSKYMVSRKTMEINPRHPVIQALKTKSETDPDSASVKDLAVLLHDSALLTSGFNLENASDFASRIQRVAREGLNVPSDAPILSEEELQIPEEEEDEENEEEAEKAEESSKKNADEEEEESGSSDKDEL